MSQLKSATSLPEPTVGPGGSVEREIDADDVRSVLDNFDWTIGLACERIEAVSRERCFTC